MDLDFNELTGSLPGALFSLTNLETLDLNDNFLEGNIDLIGIFENLQFLQLQSKCCFPTVDHFGNKILSPWGILITLTSCFVFTGNQFTGIVPEDMGNLTMMTTFNLHENAFSGTMPESVCDLRENNGGLLKSLIADCLNTTTFGPDISCDCCSSCRG